MQIKVTKKEAMEIYSQRYLDSQGKVMRYLPLGLLSMALIAGVSLLYFVEGWLWAIVFLGFILPSIFIALKEERDSAKYARGQIKG